MGKPSQDPTYPAYAVSDTDSDIEVTRVAAVTGLRSGQNRRNFDRGASGSEAGDIRHGKTVTAAGEGATELATRGCKPSSTDGTEAVVEMPGVVVYRLEVCATGFLSEAGAVWIRDAGCGEDGSDACVSDNFKCSGRKLNTGNIYPLANVASARLSETVAVGSPTIWGGGRPDNGETILSEGEDIRNMNEGSIEDDERKTWRDWCDSAFWTAFGTFPSAADGPQPTVAFSDRLFSEEVLTYSAVSVHKELPMLALRIFSNVGVTVIPPVVDRPVQRIMDGLLGKGCSERQTDG